MIIDRFGARDQDVASLSGRGRALLVLLAAGACLVLGLVAGVGSKLADSAGISWCGQFTSMLGAWVLMISFVAVTAGTAWTAAWRSALFMAAAMAGYYLQERREILAVPQSALAWLMLSVTAAPVFAALVQPARGRGVAAGLSLALPVSVLVAEAWPGVAAGGVPSGSDLANLLAALAFVLVVRPNPAKIAVAGAAVVPAVWVMLLIIDQLWSLIGSLGG